MLLKTFATGNALLDGIRCQSSRRKHSDTKRGFSEHPLFLISTNIFYFCVQVLPLGCIYTFMRYEYHALTAGVRFDYALTLHFDTTFSTRPRTDNYKFLVQRFLTLFIKQLNQRFYGKKSLNPDYQGPKVYVFPSIENLDSSRFEPVHFHLAIGNLPTTDFDEVQNTIKKCWSKVPHARTSTKGIRVNEIYYEKGWINYLSKEHKDIDSSAIQFDQIHV